MDQITRNTARHENERLEDVCLEGQRIKVDIEM